MTYGTDRERAFVGKIIAECSDDKEIGFSQLPSFDLNKIKDELKNTLCEKFWDENKFGLYLVMCCSY